MSKSPGFEELSVEIISKKRCAGCGACYASCPFEAVLEYSDGGPKIIGECKNCGICLRVCPRYRVDNVELEEFIFGRKRTLEETYGIQLSTNVARALDQKVKLTGQDGGVATAILLNAINADMIDGAIVSSTDPTQPWRPIPSLATKNEAILSAAGTRYSYSPGITALKNVFKERLNRIAFVGTPCQVIALRRMQKANLRKIVGSIGVIVGLFCSESFSYKGLMQEKIQKEMGICLRDVDKMNIKGRMQVKLKDGNIVEIPLKEARVYAEQYCRFCGDFSAELADISLGGVGLDGRTFTIVRTEAGRKILDAAVESDSIEIKPVDEFKTALDLMIRLSVNKRTKAQ